MDSLLLKNAKIDNSSNFYFLLLKKKNKIFFEVNKYDIGMFV
jgi:hypothetical protein